MTTTPYDKVKAAAEAGDQDAQAALIAFEEAADAIPDTTLTGKAAGLDAARRRFGPRPGDPT